VALRLILMRHAKSSWDHGGLKDFDRPLNKRGERDAPRMGRWVTTQEIAVDRCLCSTAKRTRETLALWLEGSGQSPSVEYIDDLYHASPETIFEWVKQAAGSAQTLMVIAHNPGMETLVADLSREERPFPTAATAVFEFDQLKDWSELNWKSKAKELVFQVPRELPSDDC